MNIPRLLPLGMAFFAALQVSAQTSQTENPADGKAPEIQRKSVEIRLNNGATMDSLQAQLKLLMSQYAANKPELNKDLEQLIHELRSKDKVMRFKMRELKTMQKNLEEGDEELAESLRLAEESLRNAQESLAEIDAEDLGISNVSIRVHKFGDGTGENRQFMILGNGAGVAAPDARIKELILEEGNVAVAMAPDAHTEELIANGGNVVVAIEDTRATGSISATGNASAIGGTTATANASATAGTLAVGSTSVVIGGAGSGSGRSIAITSVGTDPAASGGQNFKQRTVVMISGDDSTLTETDMGNGSHKQHQVIVRNITGSGTNETITNVYVRKFSSSELRSTNFPLPDMSAESMPLLLRDNLIMIGSDSVPVQDGRDRQMVIRIYQDTASMHTNVVVVSMSRKADTLSGGQSSVTDRNEAASTAGYTLEANRPNPFSETTTINFTLPQAGHVSLSVFDATGTLVKVLKDESMPAGSHAVAFDARGLPSGLYLYRLTANGFFETKTMTVAK